MARAGHGTTAPSLDRVALSATIHCLTGCAIGEVLGMVVGTALGWPAGGTVALSVALAFGAALGTAMLVVPGAMDAGAAAFPVNRWLVARGRGHAAVHARHGGAAPRAPHRH